MNPALILSASGCFGCQSQRTLLILRAGLLTELLGISPMTALTLLGPSSACIQCLSNERLIELQTAILYQILINGVGGGGTGLRYVFGPDDGPVGTIVPLGGVAIYVDTDRVYYWFSSAWH